MIDQRLSLIVRSPQIVEDAIRKALAEALGVRRVHLGEIDARSFGNRALEALKVVLGSSSSSGLDALAVHELEAATLAASGRFFSSKLGRRLLTIEASRLERTPGAIDASVRDSLGRRHAVRIEACANDAERVEIGRAIARSAHRRAELHAPRIHLFSLRDGRLRSFTFASGAARSAA